MNDPKMVLQSICLELGDLVGSEAFKDLSEEIQEAIEDLKENAEDAERLLP